MYGKSNFIQYNGNSSYLNFISTGTTGWVETVPWEYVRSIPIDDYVVDSVIYGDYINLITGSDVEIIRYNPVLDTVSYIENNQLTTGSCINKFEFLSDMILYTGYQYSTDLKIRYSTDGGLIYTTSATFNFSLYEYPSNFIYYNYLGIDYVYFILNSSSGSGVTLRVFRSTDGLNWTELCNQVSPWGYVRKGCVFQNELYFVSTSSDLLKFNHDTNLFEYVIEKPNGVSPKPYNYNDEYLYLASTTKGEITKYNGIDTPPSLVHDLSIYHSITDMFYYNGLIYMGSSNGKLTQLSPKTDIITYNITLDNTSPTSIYTFCSHPDGYLYTFIKDNSEIRVYRMKRENIKIKYSNDYFYNVAKYKTYNTPYNYENKFLEFNNEIYQIYGLTVGNINIAQYNNSTDTFDIKTTDSSSGRYVDDATFFNSDSEDWIYVARNSYDLDRFKLSDDFATMEEIVPGTGSSGEYLRYVTATTDINGTLFIGGRWNLGDDRCAILYSTSGNTNDFTLLWKLEGNLDPLDFHYDAYYIGDIISFKGETYWTTSMGQVWGTINSGTAPLYSYSTSTSLYLKLNVFDDKLIIAGRKRVLYSSDGLTYNNITPLNDDLDSIYDTFIIDESLILMAKSYDPYSSDGDINVLYQTKDVDTQWMLFMSDDSSSHISNSGIYSSTYNKIIISESNLCSGYSFDYGEIW